MASPQKEKGYTAIANELMEALARIRISGEARQCLDIIFRKTYGFNKRNDIIAISQFKLGTNLNGVHVCRAIDKLKRMNLIITQKGNTNGHLYRFNKDYSTWKPLPKKVTITQKGNKPLPKKGNTKVDNTKVESVHARKFPPKGGSVKNKIGENSSPDSLFRYWNERQNLIKHRKLLPFMAREVENRLKELSEDELKEVILLYDEVIGAPTTWFRYKWGLQEFMKRGYKTFLDKKFEDFLDYKQFPK